MILLSFQALYVHEYVFWRICTGVMSLLILTNVVCQWQTGYEDVMAYNLSVVSGEHD